MATIVTQQSLIDHSRQRDVFYTDQDWISEKHCHEVRNDDMEFMHHRVWSQKQVGQPTALQDIKLNA